MINARAESVFGFSEAGAVRFFRVSRRLDISPVVVVPTYNNAAELVDVLRGIERLGLDLIVVNDGCTDDTATRLEAWHASTNPSIRVQTVTHEHNRGKGAALMSGFTAALAAGYTHAATIDSDGQFDPADIPALLEAAATHGEALVLGVRDTATANYPSASRLGRMVSNLAIFLECGRRISDSQCGLRVYPLRLFEGVRIRAGRFAFEAEVLTRAAWAGCRIVEVPVRCIYKPRGQHTSHFRTRRDSLHGVALHLRLLARTVLPVPHRGFMSQPHGHIRPAAAPLLRRLWWWINPARAWRQVRNARAGRGEVAAALATGVFVANMPIYPLQTILALYVAQRLHLHPAVVVAGSMVSTPPVGFVLIGAAIATGHIILTGTLPFPSEYDMTQIRPLTVAGRTLAEWVVGSVVVGLVTAVLAFTAAYTLLGVPRRTASRR